MRSTAIFGLVIGFVAALVVEKIARSLNSGVSDEFAVQYLMSAILMALLAVKVKGKQ